MILPYTDYHIIVAIKNVISIMVSPPPPPPPLLLLLLLLLLPAQEKRDGLTTGGVGLDRLLRCVRIRYILCTYLSHGAVGCWMVLLLLLLLLLYMMCPAQQKR